LNKGNGDTGNNISIVSPSKRDTNSLFDRLKELVQFIEHEMQEKQEELEVQAEELESQNQELHKTNEELQKAEETSSLLAAIVRSSDDAIVSNTLDGIITSWNKGAERMFGYSANDAIGKKISMLTPPRHKNEVPGLVNKIKNGEHIEHFETVRISKYGKLIDVSLSISPIRDKSGNIVGAASIKRDITKQKRAEEERSLLAAIVESSDNAIISKTLDGVITSWNKAAERMFGYTSSEAIGKNISILHPPGYMDEIPGILTRIKNGERVEHFETVRLRKDGILINVSITVSPIRNKSGMIVGASSIKTDITERKRMEAALQEKQEEIEVQAEELEAQNEELRTNNQELEEAKLQAELYLDLMGHDISNMHQIAINQLELAEEIMDEEGRLEKDNKELIDTSLKTLQRSAKLIDEVRKLQKVMSGEYKIETIDLVKILEDIVEAYSNIPNSNVSINYNNNYVPGNSCLVEATPLLKDVLINLVDNAVKHNKNSPIIDIKVFREYEQGRSLCKIAIEDNGIGIPDSKKGEVFQRFRRGQTTARGTGLGLYIVKTLVESFNGTVSVENKVPGDYTKGSRFIIQLPAVEGIYGS